METKICRLCGIEKPLSEFYFIKAKEKYKTECKPCWSKYKKEHRRNRANKKELIKIEEELIKQGKKKCKACKQIKNINHFYVRSDNGKLHNKCKMCEKTIYKNARKKWLEQNIQKCREYSKKYYKNNKQKIKAQKNKNKYFKNRKMKDNIFKTRCLIHGAIYNVFVKKGNSKGKNVSKILGCSNKMFYNYLLETFKQNYGYEWDETELVDIDHIIPISNAKTIEEVLNLNRYENLQLLKRKDNREKSNKLNWKLNRD